MLADQTAGQPQHSRDFIGVHAVEVPQDEHSSLIIGEMIEGVLNHRPEMLRLPFLEGLGTKGRLGAAFLIAGVAFPVEPFHEFFDALLLASLPSAAQQKCLIKAEAVGPAGEGRDFLKSVQL